MTEYSLKVHIRSLLQTKAYGQIICVKKDESFVRDDKGRGGHTYKPEKPRRKTKKE